MTCAGKSCSCAVEQASGVELKGKLYCSERCSEGRGCDHAGCNCGDFPAAEPVSDLGDPRHPR